MDPPNREVVFRVRVVRDVRAKLCAMLPGAWSLRDNRVVRLLLPLLLLLLLRPRPGLRCTGKCLGKCPGTPWATVSRDTVSRDTTCCALLLLLLLLLLLRPRPVGHGVPGHHTTRHHEHH